MICPNCGNESGQSVFCAFCGTRLQAYEPANEPLFNQNPYAEQTAQANPAPYPQQAVQPGPAPHPQQAVQPGPAPYSQQAVQPGPAPYPQQAVQSGPFYQPPEPKASAPKKKSKALPIVLASLVAAVVLAGIAICVVSAITYNKGLIGAIVELTDEDISHRNNLLNYDGYDDYDMYTESFDDNVTYSVGEVFDFDYANVSLKNVSLDKKISNGECIYKFEFEYNLLDASSVELYYIELLDENDDYFFCYDENTYSDDAAVKLDDKNKSQTVSLYYRGPEINSPVTFTLESYDSVVTPPDTSITVTADFEVKPTDIKK